MKQLPAANRSLYASNDPYSGSEAENSAAINSMISYAGPYTAHDGYVVHHVTQSSCSNGVGTEQRREVAFTASGLRLSAANARFQGLDVTACVDWKRA